MKPISLLYAHDTRSGQQSYRIVAQSTDLAREQLAKVKVLITRLCFDTRALEAVSGFFALWLTPEERIIGNINVRQVGDNKTLVCRMILLDKSDCNLLNWLQYLEPADHWQPLDNGSLPSPQPPETNLRKSTSASALSETQLVLPWDLIAANNSEIIRRWYSGLSASAQKKACFIAPCLSPLSRIQCYLADTYLIAGRHLSSKAGNTQPRRQPFISKQVAIILVLVGLVSGYFIGSDTAPIEQVTDVVEGTPGEQARVAIAILDFSPKQEERLESLCAGLEELVEKYAEFTRWNEGLGGRAQPDFSSWSHYLDDAADSEKPINERIDQLSIAMESMGDLLERPLEVSSAVDDLLERLETSENLSSKIRTNLNWQKNQANSNFKAITEVAETLIAELEAALRELKIQANPKD